MWDAEQNAAPVGGIFCIQASAGRKLYTGIMGTSKHPPAAPDAAAHNGSGNGHGNGSSAAEAGQPRTDSDITARIKAALGLLPDLLALRVGVETHDGVVTLTRSVETRRQTEIAVVIAAKTVGVKYVNDHLIATPQRKKTGPRMPGSAGFRGSSGARDE